MKILERCQWCRSSVFTVNCEHISNFFLLIDFEQTKVCWVHIEKIKTFENKIRYIMRYVIVIQVWPNLINKYLWSYATTTLWVNQRDIFPKEFTSDFYSAFKKWDSHSKWPAAHLSFYQLLFIDFACWKANYIFWYNLF